MRSSHVLMLIGVLLLFGVAGASAQDEVATPMPHAAPGAAYPDIPEVDMARHCTRIRRARTPVPYLYPSRALDVGRSGAALLDCVIGEDGRMQTCQVLQEEPQRFGFGDAAVNIACHFRADPATIADHQTTSQMPADTRFYRRNAEGEPWRARVPIRFDVR